MAMGGGYGDLDTIGPHHPGITGINRSHERDGCGALADHLGVGIAINPRNKRRGKRVIRQDKNHESSDIRRGRNRGVHHERSRATMVHTQHLTNEGTLASPLGASTNKTDAGELNGRR